MFLGRAYSPDLVILWKICRVLLHVRVLSYLNMTWLLDQNYPVIFGLFCQFKHLSVLFLLIIKLPKLGQDPVDTLYSEGVNTYGCIPNHGRLKTLLSYLAVPSHPENNKVYYVETIGYTLVGQKYKNGTGFMGHPVESKFLSIGWDSNHPASV